MHVVHAAATISQETDIVVIGSQSILGSHPSPPVGDKLAKLIADGIEAMVCP